MTDEEMAKEWVKNHTRVYENDDIGLTEVILPKAEQAFLAGLKAGRPEWHDLRKDPKDVPLIEGRYLCILDYKRVHRMPVVLMYADDHLGHFVWVADDDEIYDGCVSKWAEIPKFEEVSE